MPIGSFSGRGSDFSPFQFILEQRQRAVEAEQSRKMQQKQMQQSFLMAMLAKRQQESEQAQLASQFQQSQQQRIAEKAQADQQFQSEQERLRSAATAQEAQRSLAEQRYADQAKRILENQRRDDERAALAVAKKEQDQRNLQGVEGDVAQMGEGAFGKFSAGPDISALEAEVAAANTAMQSDASAGALQRLRGAEAALETAKAVGSPDSLEALDKAEAALRNHASAMPDAGAKVAYLAAIAKWKDKQEAEILRRQAKADYSAERKLRGKAAQDEQARKVKADQNKTKMAAAKAELAGIQDDLKMWAEDLLDSPGNTDIQKKIDNARARRNELYKELAAME